MKSTSENTLIVHGSVNNWVKNAFEYEGFTVSRLQEIEANPSICLNYQFIIFFDNSINVSLCQVITKISNAQICIFFWNSVNDNAYIYRALGASVTTAFLKSSETTHIPFANTLAVCSMNFYTQTLEKSTTLENDFIFCGADKGRKEIIHEYESIFSQLGIYGKSYIVDYSSASSYAECPELAYEDYLRKVNNARSILDIQYKGQEGPTQRILEAAFLEKKLITDYAPIIESELYNPHNVFILGKDDIMSLPLFLNSPFEKYSTDLLDKYKLKSWLAAVTTNYKEDYSFELGKEQHFCKICGHKGLFDTYLTLEKKYSTQEKNKYFVCKKCNCLQIENIPKNLEQYYEEERNNFKSPTVTFKPINEIYDKRILDVGCKTGTFLCSLAEEGYINLSGCEPLLDNDVFYSNGVHIYSADICQLSELQENKYDEIWMNDSFEHMPNPLEVLASAHKLLNKDGVLIIKTPVFPSVAFESFRENWYSFDAPRHLFIHSVDSMKYIATETGFDVVSVQYDSNFRQFYGSILYQLKLPEQLHSIDIAKLFISSNDLNDFQQLSTEINTLQNGDHATFVLTPKKSKPLA